MADETRAFQAEVAKLLQIVTNSLYTQKEIFLRELISNAADACDKLRYAALTQSELIADDPDFRIRLIVDSTAKTLTVEDNGVGMTRDELIENLGTIARSGTSRFMTDLKAKSDNEGKDGPDVNLIGQFGVGFYSAFMVARQVTVVSRKAGETQAWRWASDGLGDFTVSEAEREQRGSSVTLHLKDEELEFLDEARLRQVVKTYSDHIAVPIVLGMGKPATGNTLNTASALWTRPRKDVTEEQYREFYHHVGHLFDDPWLTIHAKVEGKVEYTFLLFVPTNRPMDVFDPNRRSQLKLYVKRVFITDDCEELVPAYLRFLRGIVDCQDLPLNISRETLQNNPVVTTIRRTLAKRVLNELGKKAESDATDYARFWATFGAVLKEGIYEDTDNRDALLKLSRFRSTRTAAPAGKDQPAELVSLQQYVERLQTGQDAIYYIAGDDAETLARSPQLEGFRTKGVEVLLMTDPVDEFWINAVTDYDGKKLVSVTRGSIDLDKFDASDVPAETTTPADDSKVNALVALLKLNLGSKVKDVRATQRLNESPVCLVAAEGDLDLHIERLLKQHQRLDKTSTRILEINPRHALIKALAGALEQDGAADRLADISQLLLDQALIVEGEPLPDPAGFSRRLADVMTRGFGG